MATPLPQEPRPPLRLVRGGVAVEAPPMRAPQPSLDDSELLRAMKAGDVGAATAFHDRIRPQVDRTLYRLLGRRDSDHEDLAQLALIELVYTIDRFRGDCSLDSWVSTITAHVAYKQLRRRKTERRIFSGAEPESTMPAASVRGHGSQVIARDLMVRVTRLLEDMDEAKSWTYVLHDVAGYDLKEIAQITGVSVAAAQTRLVRGRRELQERIQSDPELAAYLTELEGGP
jgi:RNA polymerase sigma-70 factor (ECF subfamily)